MSPGTDVLVLDLVTPRSTGGLPCPDALEQIDLAAALVAPELAARGVRVRVRVSSGGDPAVGATSFPWLRVDGVAVRPDGARSCGQRGATVCGTWEWQGATYGAPPAELLTAAIHERLDGGRI